MAHFSPRGYKNPATVGEINDPAFWQTVGENQDARFLEAKAAADLVSGEAAAATAKANEAKAAADFAGQRAAGAVANAISAREAAEDAEEAVADVTGVWETRLHQVEAAAGYAPGDATDAAMTNIATQEDTQFRAALNAQLAPKLDASVASEIFVRGVVSETEPSDPTVGMVWFSPLPPPTLQDTLLADPNLIARWTAQDAPLGALASLAPSDGEWSTPLTQTAAANRPIVTSNGPDGTKTIEFTAAQGHYLEGAGASVVSQPATVFTVFRAANTASRSIISGLNAFGYLGLQTTSARALMMNSNTQASGIQSSGWPVAPEWVIAATVYQADGTGRFYVSSLTPLTGPMAAGATMQNFRLGRRSGSSVDCTDMSLSDLAIVERAMSHDEVSSVLRAYAGEYGLVLS